MDKELYIKLKTEYQKAGIEELRQNLKAAGKDIDLFKQGLYTGGESFDQLKTKAKYFSDEVKSTSREMKGLDGTVKKSSAQMLEMGENVATIGIALQQFASQLVDIGKKLFDVAQKGAEFKNLKSHFQELEGGAEAASQKLELLKSASALNMNDAELIKYSNQMGDLGYTTDQTAKFLDIAEIASDNLGITIEEANSKLLAFVETGRGRGLKEMGISASEVEEKVKELAQAQGLNIKKLDEESQKRLRSQAIITLYGHSLDQIKKKEMDEADQLQSISVTFENAKLKIGEFVAGVLTKLASVFGTTNENMAMFITISVAIVAAVGTLTLAFSALAVAVGTATAGISVVVGLIATLGLAGVTTALIKTSNATDQATKSFEQLGKELNKGEEDIKTLEDKLNNISTVLTTDINTKEYKNALESLSAEYPEIITGIDQTTGKYIINNDAIVTLNNSLREELDLRTKINAQTSKVQAATAMTEYDEDVKKIDEINKEIEKNQDIVDAYNSSILGYAINSKGYWYVTEDQAEAATKKVDNLKLQLLTLPQPIDTLKKKWTGMILEGLKSGNITTVLNNIQTSLNGDAEKVILLKNTFNGLSNNAVLEFLNIDKAINNSANLMKVFTLALNYIKSDNVILQQEGERILNELIAKFQNVPETKKTPKPPKPPEEEKKEATELEKLNKEYERNLELLEGKIARGNEDGKKIKDKLILLDEYLSKLMQVNVTEEEKEDWEKKVNSLRTERYNTQKKILEDEVNNYIENSKEKTDIIKKEVEDEKISRGEAIAMLEKENLALEAQLELYKEFPDILEKINKQKEENQKGIDKYNNDSDKLINNLKEENEEIKSNLSDNKYEKKLDEIKRKYDKQIAIVEQKIKLEEESANPNTALLVQYYDKLSNLQKEREKEIKKTEKERSKEFFESMSNAFSGAQDIARNINQLFTDGSQTVFDKFSEVFSIVERIMTYIDSTKEIIGMIQSIIKASSGGGIFGFIGKLFGFASGGLIQGPGTSKSDSIPALLSNGEFVVNATATAQYLPLLESINGNVSTNYGRYANGGMANNMNKNFNKNINNVYVSADTDAIKFIATNYPLYKKNYNYRKL